WDILAIQEPYINPATGYTIVLPQWDVYYPSLPPNTPHNHIRSITFVNKSLLSESYSQIHIPSPSITAAQITIPSQSIEIYNLY
ncbi:hypothetical protein CPB86DRAFT_670251, partial [Serendipita vermifera]